MAHAKSWHREHRRKRLAYPFHVRVLHEPDTWHMHYDMLRTLAAQSGDFLSWDETVVAEDGVQQWAVFGFGTAGGKEKFEAGLAPVLAIEIKVTPGVSLPNGLANPDRDFSGLLRRMANKGRYSR